jgi:hypothetical protein
MHKAYGYSVLLFTSPAVAILLFTIEQEPNTEFSNVLLWYHANKVSLNLKKTKYNTYVKVADAQSGL